MVAAESVVTRDVPAYAVVGGNPARIISYRFPDAVIEGLKKIEWWYWDTDKLLNAKADMLGEPEAFVDKYAGEYSLLERKSGNYLPRISEIKNPIILYFMDFDDDYPVYTRVIANFIKEFSQGQAELVLCYNAESDRDIGVMNTICDTLLQEVTEQCFINVCGISKEDEEAIISEVDYLITNRSQSMLRRVSYANKYQVQCLSGVDIPLFSAELCRNMLP